VWTYLDKYLRGISWYRNHHIVRQQAATSAWRAGDMNAGRTDAGAWRSMAAKDIWLADYAFAAFRAMARYTVATSTNATYCDISTLSHILRL